MVVVVCGLLGGLFARLLAASIEGLPDRFSRWRKEAPIRFAAGAGLAVAIIGLVSGGATFGAGAEEVRNMLAGESDISHLYVLLKFVATWITSWSGVPAGIFAPSLSIGAGIGHDVAQVFAGSHSALAPSLIALGMAGFLAAATQAPLTSFIIVMEMINGRSMVLSLMAGAMLASLIARLISRPLYSTLSALMIQAVVKTAAPPERTGTPAAEADSSPADTPSAAASTTATTEAAPAVSADAVTSEAAAPTEAPDTPPQPPGGPTERSTSRNAPPQAGLFDNESPAAKPATPEKPAD